ncbi:MAG: Maf family protein [Candidatus Paceibacterota bacterium]
MKLILGSSSKYRKDILEKAGYVFDVLAPDIDEKLIKTNDPYERPLILAHAKADALVARVKEPAFVIALDQVVVYEGKLYEKPIDEKEARIFFDHYNTGGVPESICAVVVVNTRTGKRYNGVDKVKIFFKHIPNTVIENFIKKNQPLTRAGGFGIQDTVLEPYVKKIEGTEDSVAGMPIHLLKKLLTEAGY